MANIHTPNITPEDNNQEPRKFPWDFLGRYESSIVVGRTREVDWKIVYEVKDIKYQMGNKDDNRNRTEISEGEYKYIKAEYDKHVEEKNFEEKLKNTWYMSGFGFESGETYSRLLLNVLDQNQVSKVDEIPAHIEQEKKLNEANTEYHYAFDDKFCGLRYYIKDSKTIYEREIPFSIEEYFEISEDEYMLHYNSQKKQLELNKAMKEKRDKRKSSLNEKGYTREAEHWGDQNYQEQLLKVLDNQDIPTIWEIPEIIEQQSLEKYKDNNEITKKKEPDFYEQNITHLLDEYEKAVEIGKIADFNIMKIAELFTKWNVKDIELFYRFEKLKKANIVNNFKKIYTYWIKITNSKPDKNGFTKLVYGYNQEETDTVGRREYEEISYFVSHIGGKISDIEPNYEKFVAKIKKWYQAEWTKFLIWEIAYFSEKYGFTKYSLNKLGISNETIHERREEKNQMIILEFKNILEYKLNWNKLNEENFEEIILIVNKIEENLKTADMENKNTKHSKDDIINVLEKKIKENIESIKNKEKPLKAERGNKLDLSYKRQIARKKWLTDALYKQLYILSPEVAKQIWREENKELYIEEYKSFFRDNFLNKRKQEWNIDTNDLEAVKEKVIPEVKNKFYRYAKKRGTIRKEKQETKVPTRIDWKRGNRLMLKLMNAAFFDTGNSLLIKTAYPDDKKRRIIRQEYIQIITKEIITEIQERIIQKETFDMAEYYMINPINHVYKSYWGKGSIAKIDPKTVEIIDTITKENFKKDWEKRINTIEKNLNKKIETEEQNQENNKEIYWWIVWFKEFCYRYLRYFLDGKVNFNGIPAEEIASIAEENMEWKGNIAESCIDDTTTLNLKLNELERYLEEDIFDTYKNFYRRLDPSRAQIIERILQSRFFRNGKSGWKLQRVIEDKIVEQFGVITMEPEQNTFIIEYLKESLSSIILNDIDTWSDKLYLSESDKQKIEIYINEYMHNIWNKIVLEHNNFKSLQ